MNHTFSVWAPKAQSVELELGRQRLPMRAGAQGWFSLSTEAGPDDDYGFRVDGGFRRPDPRSQHQPAGVHGPSRLVDHGAFPWTDAAWRGLPFNDAVLYELHIGTFTAEGTFAAAVDRLDDLVELGVNAVEIMPVAEFAGNRGWGYDGVDLFAVHHAYGGPAGLKAFVDACHARGLAVVMDAVYNHLGPEGNYLAEFGPYFTDRYTTPWGPAINYDGPGSDEVRAFVIDNAVMWLRDYHCDGLRLDAVHAILDMSAVHILEALATRAGLLADELGRPLWVIAESDLNDPRLVRKAACGGDGLTAQWSDDFHHAVHALLTGDRGGYYEDFGDIESVAVALRQAFVYDGRYSRYRGRTIGRPIGDAPLSRFVGYAQNHDQVGNRARGDRLSHIVGTGRARMAAALTLLSPFVPLIFQGEEWAASSPFQYFTDLGDPGLRRAVSEGRRSEFAAFGWNPADVPDPQQLETFARSKLRWDERNEPDHAAMLQWYRELIALRRATPGLRSGDASQVDTWYDAEKCVLVYSNAGIVVACNLGGDVVNIEKASGAQLAPDTVGVWRVSAGTASVREWRATPASEVATRPRGD